MEESINAELDKTAVQLRPLRLWHAMVCWRLAHDRTVRSVSYSSEPPTVWQHVRWMLRWAGTGGAHRGWLVHELTWPHGVLGIVRIGPDRYVGGAAGEVHVALFAWARGVRYGRQALQQAAAWHAANRSVPLNAYIKDTNVRAQRAFSAAGYSYVGPAEDGYVVHVADKNQPKEG